MAKTKTNAPLWSTERIYSKKTRSESNEFLLTQLYPDKGKKIMAQMKTIFSCLTGTEPVKLIKNVNPKAKEYLPAKEGTRDEVIQ